MSDTILLKLAEQIPALVLFAVFFGFMLTMGVKAVERRDKQFLKGLSANTSALEKLGRTIERNFPHKRRK